MNKSPFTLPRMKNNLLLLALLALAGTPLLADAAAGRFLFVSGPAQIIAANGHARAAHRGDSFDQGETIATAAHTIAQLRMEDGNMLSVRPNTRLRIDQFSYHGHPQASDRNYIRLTKGAFRSITGAIGKEHYRIITPDATIGIRGTDHVALYVPAGSSATIPAGTYDKVNTGRTFLATLHGMIEIAPNQAGYAASAAAAPHLLPVIPDFLAASSTPPGHTASVSSQQVPVAASSSSGTTGQDNGSSTTKAQTDPMLTGDSSTVNAVKADKGHENATRADNYVENNDLASAKGQRDTGLTDSPADSNGAMISKGHMDMTFANSPKASLSGQGSLPPTIASQPGIVTPVQAAVPPVQTIATPVQTIVSPVQTIVTPVQTVVTPQPQLQLPPEFTTPIHQPGGPGGHGRH